MKKTICSVLARIFHFFLMVVIVGHAWADTADTQMPNYYAEPGINPTRDYLNQHFGEHIDPFTGKLQHHYVDIYIPGNGGLDLKVQRSYTSVDENPSTERTPTGLGWTIHFGRVLATSATCEEKLWATNRKAPILEMPDGSRQMFVTWNQDSSNQTLISAGRWRATCSGSGYVVTSPEGVVYTMSQPRTIAGGAHPVYAWYTTQILDKNGNSISISYNTSTPIGAVISGVSTSDGRLLIFNYFDAGGGKYQLTSIAANTSPAQTYSYQYTDDQSGGSGYFFLTGVVRPDGSSWAYDYRYSPGNGRYSMSSVTYPQGGAISYQYGIQYFNANSNIRTTVVTSKNASDGNWSFSYAPGSAGVNDRTTVTTPNGTVTYDHVGYNTVGSETVWKIGLLARKTYSAGGSTVETQTYTWQGQAISAQDNARSQLFVGGAPVDANSYAPLLTQKAIVREGTAYTTSYSSYDIFGNPGVISESGNDGVTRAVGYGYCINQTKWLLRPVANETISLNGATQGTISRTYVGTCTNLQSENRFGVVTNFTYHPSGDLASRRDARGYTTGFSDYKRGIPQSESHPESISISRVVSAAGVITSETNGEGFATSYVYDGLNRLTGVTHPIGNSISISWTNSSTTLTRGNYRHVTYFDGYGRIIQMNAGPVAGTPIIKTFGYDALGQRTFESHPSSGVATSAGTRFTYDILGRLKSAAQVSASGTTLATRTLSYGSANVTTVTNERGNATAYGYRSFGDPDERVLLSITPPAGTNANTVISRNVFGQITGVAQGVSGVGPGILTRSYGYDSRRYLTSITDPETGTTVFGRDALGNMTSRRVGGSGTVSFGYDGNNRLVSINYADSSRDVTQDWNKNGKLEYASNGLSTRRWTYDGNENLVSESLEISDGQSFVVGYAYDGNDQLSGITYPRNGVTVSYAPDALGRPTAASPFVTAVSYYPSGQISAMTFANGVTTNYGQDNRLRVSSISTQKGGTSFVSMGYGYDVISNITSISDGATVANNRTLGYDALDRLTSVNGYAITYDGIGNILQQNFGGALGTGTLNYSYDSQNRLASTSGLKNYVFTYDLYGNVVSNGINNFSYNDASNLTTIDPGTSAQVTFEYDTSGMRVLKRNGGVTTYSVYGHAGQLLLEFDPQGNTRTDHFYLGGQRVASKTASAYFPASITLQVSASKINPGESVTLTAGVSGSGASGTVRFYDRGVLIGSLTLSNGVATLTTGPLAFGAHSFTATYSGDSINASASTGTSTTVLSGNVAAMVMQIINSILLDE